MGSNHHDIPVPLPRWTSATVHIDNPQISYTAKVNTESLVLGVVEPSQEFYFYLPDLTCFVHKQYRTEFSQSACLGSSTDTLSSLSP